MIEITEVKYCLYARKSSEQVERQAMSIDSQLKEILAIAERDGLNITMIKKESHSAKQSSQRSVFYVASFLGASSCESSYLLNLCFEPPVHSQIKRPINESLYLAGAKVP